MNIWWEGLERHGRGLEGVEGGGKEGLHGQSDRPLQALQGMTPAGNGRETRLRNTLYVGNGKHGPFDFTAGNYFGLSQHD